MLYQIGIKVYLIIILVRLTTFNFCSPVESGSSKFIDSY